MSNSLPIEFINCPHPSRGDLAETRDKRRAQGEPQFTAPGPQAAGSRERQSGHPEIGFGRLRAAERSVAAGFRPAQRRRHLPPSSRLGLGPGTGWVRGAAEGNLEVDVPQEHLLTLKGHLHGSARCWPHTTTSAANAQRGARVLEALPWGPAPMRKYGAKNTGELA